jgi:hypothetical protein
MPTHPSGLANASAFPGLIDQASQNRTYAPPSSGSRVIRPRSPLIDLAHLGARTARRRLPARYANRVARRRMSAALPLLSGYGGEKQFCSKIGPCQVRRPLKRIVIVWLWR